MNRSTHPRQGSRRLLLAASGAALLAAGPAVALAASSVNGKIPDGRYYPGNGLKGIVENAPAVEFDVGAHAYLHPLFIQCVPTANIAQALENESSGQADIYADTKKVTLRNGSFSYNGRAEVSDGSPPSIATSTLDIYGKFVSHGKVYHYTDTLGDPATATLVFTGTVSSPDCVGATKSYAFKEFRLHSADDTNPVIP